MRRLSISAASLRTRFIIGMGMTLVPLVMVALSATLALERSHGALHEVVEEASQELAVLLRLQVLLERANSSIQNCLSLGRRAAAGCEGFRDSRVTLDAAFQGAATAPFALPEERRLLYSAWEHWERAGDLGESILAVAEARKGLAREIEALHAHIGRAVEMLERAHNLSEWEMTASLTSVRGTRRRTALLMLAVLAVGVAITGTGATMLARSVLRPITKLEHGAERFAAGDLEHRVDLSRPAELARLGTRFNAMADSLARSQAALMEVAVRDGLTGLYNHRELQRCLTEEVERARDSGEPFALLLLDVDRFKTVNDTLGHQAGDEVLRGVAARLSEAARPTDLVARYGGDEFAILLRRTSGTGGLAMAERVRALVASEMTSVIPGTPTEIPISLGEITISVGVAACPDDASSEEDIIRKADAALYAAKRAGGNRAAA